MSGIHYDKNDSFSNEYYDNARFASDNISETSDWSDCAFFDEDDCEVHLNIPTTIVREPYSPTNRIKYINSEPDYFPKPKIEEIDTLNVFGNEKDGPPSHSPMSILTKLHEERRNLNTPVSSNGYEEWMKRSKSESWILSDHVSNSNSDDSDQEKDKATKRKIHAMSQPNVLKSILSRKKYFNEISSND